jgi:hypothetical protein
VILGRAFARSSPGWPAFTLAAVAVAAARSQQPFDHGWLVAYLALVGGLTQLIAGAGQFATPRAVRTRAPGTQT